MVDRPDPGIIAIVGYWVVFTKAGEAGWKSIIPIYSTIVLLKIVGRPWWWILLMLIPLVNLVILAIVYVDLAQSFGHSILFHSRPVPAALIFLLVLAFGSSQVRGPGRPRPSVAGPPAYRRLPRHRRA